jgi:hypothetical protein
VRIQEGDSFARNHNTYFSASCKCQSESEFELPLNCITFCLDRYPIKNEAGPAINNAEAEICRKIRFNTFKIRHVIKHYVNSKVSNLKIYNLMRNWQLSYIAVLSCFM